jgi:hypothetical protein
MEIWETSTRRKVDDVADRRRSHAIRANAALMVLISIEAMIPSSPLLARPFSPSIRQLTRTASVIAIVEIRQIDEAMIQAHVLETIKGQGVPADMTIIRNYEGNIESPLVHRDGGERMIVFVNRKGDLFEPTFEDSSLVSVPQLQRELSSLDKYKRAIKTVMRYDAAASPTERVGILFEMLNDNYFCQQSAIEIIYLEKPRDYPTVRLVQPLTELAKDEGNRVAVPAVQALGRIADKTLIPTFIELLNSGNVYVRETAFNILKDKTRAPLTFDPRGAEQQRKQDARQWSQWWQQNKDRVQLYY